MCTLCLPLCSTRSDPVQKHTLSNTGERSTVTYFWQIGEQGTNIIMPTKFSSWMHADPEGSKGGALGGYTLLATQVEMYQKDSVHYTCSHMPFHMFLHFELSSLSRALYTAVITHSKSIHILAHKTVSELYWNFVRQSITFAKRFVKEH